MSEVSPPPSQLAYLAGLMDGEGTWNIQIQRRGILSPRMCMSLKYGYEVLDLLVDAFGGAIYVCPDRMRRWSLGGKERLVRATNLLLPYLIIKRKVAETFLLALTMFPGTGNRWDEGARIETEDLALNLNRHET